MWGRLLVLLFGVLFALHGSSSDLQAAFISFWAAAALRAFLMRLLPLICYNCFGVVFCKHTKKPLLVLDFERLFCFPGLQISQALNLFCHLLPLLGSSWALYQIRIE